MARYNFRELVIDSRTGLNPRQNFVLGTGSNYYITIKDIHDGKIVITDKTDRVDDAAIAIINRRSRIKNGDILFTSIGRIGETAIVTNKDDTWDVNESVFVFTVDTKLITQEFFCMLFQSKSVQEQLTRDSSGSTFKSIKMNQLEKMVFNIPSLEEQQRIANILGETNKLIALRKEQLVKLDELVKSRFVELFDDCNKQTSIKESGLTISDGNYSSKYPRSEEFVESGIPFIRANNLKNGTVVDEDMYFITPEKHAILLKGHLKPNDVLITTRGNIGQVAIVPDEHNDSNINAQIVLLRDKNGRFVPQYLLWALQAEETKAQYIELQTGTALKQLPVGRLEQVVIKEPPIDLQQQFAAFVEQVDKSKLAIQESLEKLETLKKALMQKYFG